MDLKDFIEETISGIVEATANLQIKYEEQGVIVNPPLSVKERDIYEHENASHRYRRVEVVEFDVAVTAATESAAGGKAGLRIFSAEVGADGKHTRNNEQVSRVKFSIPIVLSASSIEGQNRAAAATADVESRRRQEQIRVNSRHEKSWISR